ncbi:hypothetical protein [Geminicoccus flavidas]|uniref:hypothetical protein n=1 Tax=Geminicoccus flavidas TaxID=2506407 RepID=UPI00135C0DCB|nr:hypothetical protein [Geminicoccus flavidas]
MGRESPEPELWSARDRLEAVEVTLRASDVELVAKLADILAGNDLESERLRELIQDVLSRPDGFPGHERSEDEILH